MNTMEIKNTKHNRSAFARLRAVLACAAKDESRAAIAGRVLIEKDEDGIAVTATDGRRLRQDRFELEAEPGVFTIKVNTNKTIFLAKAEDDLSFPNYRQVIPSVEEERAYRLQGTGKNFVLRACAGLLCWLDPKLVELGEDEDVDLFVQRSNPSLGTVLARNDVTTLVVMPLRLDQPWIRDLEAIQRERVLESLEDREALAA
jgi:hypothetical protein